MTTVCVNVGCGTSPTPGWLNVDASPSVRLAQVPVVRTVVAPLLGSGQRSYLAYCRSHHIVYADATRRLPVPDGGARVIYSCHMLEHLSRREANRFMLEARRALAPGGVLRIVVPDLEAAARRYLDHRMADDFLYSTYLGRTTPETFQEWISYHLFLDRHLHKWMYDEYTLTSLVLAHGFTAPVRLAAGETTIPEPGALDLTQRVEDSIVLEAHVRSTPP